VRPTSGCERLKELCEGGECSSVLALALTVLHELHVASPRTPYFEDLAAAPPPGVPLLWPEEDVMRLAGSSLLPTKDGDSAAAKASAVVAAAAATASFEEDVRPVMTAVGIEYLPA